MAREWLSRCQIVSPVILRPELPDRQAGKWTKLASATAAKPKPSVAAFRIPVAPRILRFLGFCWWERGGERRMASKQMEESSDSWTEREGGVVPVWSPLAASGRSEQFVADETSIGSGGYLQRHPQSHQLMNWRQLSPNVTRSWEMENAMQPNANGQIRHGKLDLKPRFHAPRFHGSENGEEADDDVVNV